MYLTKDLKQLYLPPKSSHKGQNGRLLVIGGSHLFHAASLWALKVASRIVDLVHYSSIEENNKLVQELKKEFRDGIVVPRSNIEDYIMEDDVILIGPGMMRVDNSNIKYEKSLPRRQSGKTQIKYQKLEQILKIESEGEQTETLTNYLLSKYPQKQWVIDAGALQMLNPDLIPVHAILTPHRMEFDNLVNKSKIKNQKSKLHIKNQKLDSLVKIFSQEYKCIVLLKGEVDLVANGLTGEIQEISGGNSGMTKGGTGDVLAGLIAALSCKNDPYLATVAGSIINKQAGDDLYKKVGLFFNASDLADQIPRTMKRLLI